MRAWNVLGLAILGFTGTLLLAQANSFSGTFRGTIDGIATTIELQQTGMQAAGTVTSEDYTYRLQATIAGNRFTGQLEDPEMGGGLPVEGLLDGDSLQLVLLIVDPQTGESQRMEQVFRRLSAITGGSSGSAGMGGPLQRLGAGDAGWAGDYSGAINGTPSSLRLEQSGQDVKGEIDAGGYRYELTGSSQGESLTGTVRDPQTGGSFPFEGISSGQGVTITLIATDAYGQTQRVPFEFQKGGATSSDRGSAGLRGGNGEQAGIQRDPALVGRWRYSDSMTSGEFSMVSEQILVIHPDGTFVLGDGRVVGGGGIGSFDSGGGEGVQSTGEWKTDNSIVYVRDPGGQWQPYARYYVEGSKMMFTFGDNSRRIWYRQ